MVRGGCEHHGRMRGLLQPGTAWYRADTEHQRGPNSPTAARHLACGANSALAAPTSFCCTSLGSQLTFYGLFYTSYLQYMNILNTMEAASLDKEQSIVGTSGMSFLRTPATL